MKILLLGDYSSLYKNLKEGLVELGHDVIIASRGDGFKNVARDIDFLSKKKGVLGRIETKILPFLKMDKLRGFDIVQLINPFEFSCKNIHPFFFYKNIINNNDKFFISAAGDDSFFWRVGRKHLRYGPFDDFLKFDLRKKKFWMESETSFSFNKWVVNNSNGIIPIMYEYEVSYANEEKRLQTIPIPMNVDNVKYRENSIESKIIVFHGLNRYGFKGTRHVEAAFSYLGKKYPNDLELIIDGKMPLNKYLEIMNRANVIIDQTNSYSLGVNGVYALAMGKVVMGGGEPESIKSFGVNETPVINILPSAESIIREVEIIMEKRNQIGGMGYSGRKFAEDVHGHIRIAEKYISVWAKEEAQRL